MTTDPRTPALPVQQTVVQGPAPSTGAETIDFPRVAASAAGTTARATLGRYELLSVIGKGGMGVVYKARDRELGRVVALKTIRGEYLGSEETVQRFLSEARAVAQLDHPEIVRIFEVAAGFKNATRLNSVTALAPFHGRADFQKLAAELAPNK